ncbi:MAG: hypothetical protein M3063_09730 [Actinomycetota bacterium]|nr:hypothetical protein [Actinomycetota bacterium]
MRLPGIVTKALAGGALGLGLLASAGGTAHAAPASGGVLAPILTCVTDNSNGTYTAHFGYNDSIPGNTYIPPGSIIPANYFSPGPTVPGQPQNFFQGSYPDFLFVTEPNSTNVTWNLGSGVSTATVGSTPCAPNTILPETATAIALPAAAAGILGMSAFILRRRHSRAASI